MEMPAQENPVILPEKVREYLLSPIHPIGKFKARFFNGLGYSQEDWKVLARDLKMILLNGDVDEVKLSKYGIKYVVSGELETPNGKRAKVVAVWIVKKGENFPRLVTAYPGDRK